MIHSNIRNRKRMSESMRRRKLREEFDEGIFTELNRNILPRLHRLYRETGSEKVLSALNELNSYMKDLMR